MARVVLLVLLLAMAAGHSNATWCVCKQGLGESVLQKALDYACGAGADCTLIHQNGACFNPNTVLAHCNFAVNSYFQRKGQASGSCDFAGAATVSPSDPSTAGCVYPSSASGNPITTTPNNNNTPSNNPNPTTQVGGSPYVTTPGSNGVVGGVGSGLGPSGVGINDDSHGQQTASTMLPLLFAIVSSGLVFLWG